MPRTSIVEGSIGLLQLISSLERGQILAFPVSHHTVECSIHDRFSQFMTRAPECRHAAKTVALPAHRRRMNCSVALPIMVDAYGLFETPGNGRMSTFVVSLVWPPISLAPNRRGQWAPATQQAQRPCFASCITWPWPLQQPVAAASIPIPTVPPKGHRLPLQLVPAAHKLSTTATLNAPR